MDTPNKIDPKFFNQVAQFAHFFAAATIYLTIGHYLLRHISMRQFCIYTVPLGIALAAWKEFYYDRHDENAATRGSDLEDFTFYCQGIAFALIVLWF